MYKGVQSILIRAPRKKVYEIAEKYPSFVRFFSKRSRIVEQSNQHSYVVVCSRLLGLFPKRWRGRGVKKRYRKIEFVQTEGLFKGLKAIWLFKNLKNGTRVFIRTSFSKPRIGNVGEWFLGRLLVESTTRKILSELKYAAEITRAK